MLHSGRDTLAQVLALLQPGGGFGFFVCFSPPPRPHLIRAAAAGRLASPLHLLNCRSPNCDFCRSRGNLELAAARPLMKRGLLPLAKQRRKYPQPEGGSCQEKESAIKYFANGILAIKRVVLPPGSCLHAFPWLMPETPVLAGLKEEVQVSMLKACRMAGGRSVPCPPEHRCCGDAQQGPRALVFPLLPKPPARGLGVNWGPGWAGFQRVGRQTRSDCSSTGGKS